MAETTVSVTSKRVLVDELELLPQPRTTTCRTFMFDRGAMIELCHRLFYWIGCEIRHRYRPGYAPPCRQTRIVSRADRDELEFHFDIYDGSTSRFRVQAVLHVGVLMTLGLDRICVRYFDLAADAFNRDPLRYFRWKDDRELALRIEDAIAGLRPASVCATTYALGVDPAVGPDRAAAFVYAGGRREGRRAEMEHRRQFDGEWLAPPFAYDRDAAEGRGEKLLREWLSPDQLACYDRNSFFLVTGCHSKRRYRICKDTAYNVQLLDADGEVEDQICFVPEGSLVLGDQMLAQKVALETDENAAMAVANRRWMGPRSGRARVRHALFGDWSAL